MWPPETVTTIVISVWGTLPAIYLLKMKDPDSGLLIPFEHKPNRWSPQSLITKLVVVSLLFISFEVKIGRFVSQYLLVGAFVANGVWIMLYVPPSCGIHQRGLYSKKHHWTLWASIRKYRWTNPGTLEINPGFFSLSYGKLEIPREFVPDVQAMLDSQCPDCQIQAP